MSRSLLKVLVLVLLLAGSSSLPAAPSGMVFRHLAAESGLPQNSVMATLQDSRGFIWLGTEDGLARYDGYAIVRYGRNRDDLAGLASSFVTAIAEDPDGDLWVAAKEGGVAHWHRATDRFTSYRHDPADPASLSSDSTRQVLLTRDGRVWVGTRGGGVNVIDRRTGRIEHYRHDPAREDSLSSDVITALHEDAMGRLWVGTDDGLNRFIPESGTFVRINRSGQGPGKSSISKISSLASELDGSLWVGTFDAGLSHLDARTGSWTVFRHAADRPDTLTGDEVRALLRDSAGRLWIGTSEGLNLFDQQSGAMLRFVHDAADPSSLADNIVLSLYQDRTGLLWVGTRGGGVSRWNPRSWALGHQAPAWLKDAYVMAFEQDRAGRVWVGTFGAGLHRIDPSSGAHTTLDEIVGRHKALPDPRVMSLLTDAAGALWIGTMTGGLSRLALDGKFTTFRAEPKVDTTLSADGVMALLQARSGRIWIGTFGGGLNILDPATGRVQRIAYDPLDPRALSAPRATALAEDPSGFIWVGTEGGGLDLVSPAGYVVRQFRPDSRRRDSLSADTIFTLHVDARGRVWVGTDGGGLDQVVGSPTKPESITFRNIAKGDGLASDIVYGIRSDAAGRLWLSSNAGLTRYDPDNGEIQVFHREHGLQGEEFNFGAHFQLREGRLCFGGATGFNIFDPTALVAQSPPPAIALTGVEVLNAPARTDVPYAQLKSFALRPRDNVVSFEFAALDFAAPARNRYRYRLQGFGGDWVELGTVHRISFTNLNPGHYRLEVRAANADGVWSETPLMLPIDVLPPTWLTGWAKIAYGVAAVLLALGIWRMQRRKLRVAGEARDRLARVVDERTSELRERNQELDRLSRAKSDFLARMSHEIRTPLNGVIGTAELLTRTELSARQAQLAGTVHSSARSLLQILNEILDLARVESGKLVLEQAPFDLRELVEGAVEPFGVEAEAKGLDLTVALPVTGPWQVVGDATRLRQVLQNLVGNAIKFTASGQVDVTVDTAAATDDRVAVSLRVQDTGIGMSRESIERIFDPFSQADESTTRRFGGTGLGLTICRQLAALMGGTLEVASEPNVGSTFTLRLALARAAEIPAPDGRALAGLKVGIVCRRPALNRALLRLAQAWQVEAEVCDAAQTLPRGMAAPDVWIVDADHLAANLDGVALRRAGDPSPPIVVLAGLAGAQRLRLEGRLGAGCIVTKPVRHQALWDALAGAANRVPAQPAVAPPVLAAKVPGLVGHVLVVEDNPVNSIVAAEMLAELGCTAIVVDNGREAVARVGTERFDLVLMDLHMPDLDGLGATALIRKIPMQDRHLPIVALTANTAASHRAQCLAAGMDGFLGKPFTLAELGETLSRWLGPGDHGRERSADTAPVPPERRGVLDSSALDRIRALERPGGPRLLGRVIAMFVSSSATQLADMRSALGRGDLAAIRGQAHSLKSASGNVGATELGQLAQALEQACERAERPAVQALVEQLFAAHPAVVAALEYETAAEVA